MAGRFDRFLDALARTEVSERAVNQYSRTAGDVRGNAVRRRNLELYLEDLHALGTRALLIGEAPSHRGGRLTGIAFVSEFASSGTCWMINETSPLLAIGVRTVVGATLLTRMLCGAR